MKLLLTLAVLITTLTSCSKKESSKLSPEDEFLNSRASYFITNFNFIENEAVSKILKEDGINLRELSYESSNCRYVITVSFEKNGALTRSGAMNANSGSELYDCFTKNNEMLTRAFIPLAQPPAELSEAALLNLLSHILKILRNNQDQTKVVNTAGKDIILSKSTNNFTWIFTTPMI